MADTYLAAAQIALRYGVHPKTPWRWARTDPTFPKPVTLTPGCTRWKLSELEGWERRRAEMAGAA